VCGGSKTGPRLGSGGLGWTRRHGDRGCFGCGGSGCRSRIFGLLGLSDLLVSNSFRFLGSLLDSRRNLLGLGGLDLLGHLLNGGSWSDLCSRLLLCGLLELVVDLAQVLLAGCDLAALVKRRVLRNRSRGRLLYAIGRGRVILELFLLLRLLSEVAEDVVEHKVTVGLLGEDKGLGETLVGLALVGDLADDLDDDVGIRALGVDVGDADLGVLELEALDALVDSLLRSASPSLGSEVMSYLLAYADADLFLLDA
jgi:hypothetical protein